jgi:WD40 repeat protein
MKSAGDNQTSSHPQLCPKCGTELNTAILEGQCPACMARILADQAELGASGAPAGMGPALPLAVGDPQADAVTDTLVRYLGDYQLLGELGRGGMGVVYKARQLSLNRIVALKLIAAEQLASPKALERFHTEAEAAANLDHPNIVPIYETGALEGRHYFTMKLVEGQSLAQRMKGLRLPMAVSTSSRPAGLSSRVAARQLEIAQFMAKVADAVHYAHQRGILHRDLKPGNILIDIAGEPHISDFGLAKRIESDSGVTHSGELLGTPAYMAPEAAAGKTRQLTTAADIYGLGVILYELLTGRPPFRAETSVETLHALLHDEPTAPRALNRAVPRDLETICLKCLQKEPAQRYTSARALAEDLRHFIHGEPLQARPVGTADKVWRWCRRKPALATVLLLLLLSFALGMAGVLWQWHSARQNAFIARQNLYAADIGAAQRALEQDNLRQALDLLRKQVPNSGETDLRGFEWRYLWRQCQSEELFSLPTRNTSWATTVAFSPDGRSLATAGRPGLEPVTIEIWDLASRKAKTAKSVPTYQVRSLSFSPDGRSLAVASEVGLCVWDAQTFQLLRSLADDPAVAAFSPSGDYLVCVDTNGMALWDTHSWSKMHSLQSPKVVMGSGWTDFRLAFAPDGSQLGVTTDNGVKLYRIPDFQEAAFFSGPLPRIRFLAFSPDGKMLAASTAAEKNIRLWDIPGQKEAKVLAGHRDSVMDVAFSPDGKSLASCSADQTIKLWEVASGELVHTLRGHEEEVYDVTWSPDGKLLASVGKDGTVKMWDASKPSLPPADLGDVRPLGFNTKGELVGSPKFTLHRSTLNFQQAFDPESQQIVSLARCAALGLKPPGTNAGSFTYYSILGNLFIDGHTVAFPTVDVDRSTKWMAIWDFDRSQCLCTVQDIRYDLLPLLFAPRRRLLAAATSNDTVSVWQIPQGTRKWMITNSDRPLAISPDETMLTTCGTSKTEAADLWDISGETVHHLATLAWPGAGSFTAAFSPDSRLLAVSTSDSRIGFWAVPSGRLVTTLTGHKRANIELSFSPDGRTLASMADDADGLVKLWNVATGRELFSLACSGDTMWGLGVAWGLGVEFSQNARSLVASRPAHTHLWFAPSWAEIALAEGKDYRVLAKDAGTWLAVGKALEKRDRFDEAIAAFKEAIQRSTAQGESDELRRSALRQRAKLLVKLQRLSEAAADNLAALNLPPRPSAAPTQCAELSPHFNGTLDFFSLYHLMPRSEFPFLNDLPRGISSLSAADGVKFDIRGVVWLNSDLHFPGVPEKVERIVLRRKAHRIHFLHGTHDWEKPGTQIASYVLHYSDGKQESLPVVYGRDVYDWQPERAPEDDPQGPKPVWKGKSGNRVYMTTWQNPRPEMEIASLDFVSSLIKCEPFLIAITTEP